MPVPVIFSAAVVPPARQFRAYSFSPYASNSPSTWVSSALPPGLTLTASTGVIAGTPTGFGPASVNMRAGIVSALTSCATTAGSTSVTCASTSGLQVGQTITGPGLVDATVIAAITSATAFVVSNVALSTTSGGAMTASLWSEEVAFLMPITAAWPTPALGFIPITLDYLTRGVTFDGITGVPCFKSGDELLQQLRVVADGITQDLNVSALKCSLKFVETDVPIVTGTAFAKVGSGTSTVYLHATTLTSTALSDALDLAARGLARIAAKNLATAEIAARTVRFLALLEFEMVFVNASGTGANPTRWTSLTVPVQVERELTAN